MIALAFIAFLTSTIFLVPMFQEFHALWWVAVWAPSTFSSILTGFGFKEFAHSLFSTINRFGFILLFVFYLIVMILTTIFGCAFKLTILNLIIYIKGIIGGINGSFDGLFF